MMGKLLLIKHLVNIVREVVEHRCCLTLSGIRQLSRAHKAQVARAFRPAFDISRGQCDHAASFRRTWPFARGAKLAQYPPFGRPPLPAIAFIISSASRNIRHLKRRPVMTITFSGRLLTGQCTSLLTLERLRISQIN